MIKKSVFEDELIAGMQKELIKNATNQATDNLGKAVDFLNSAIEIFEDAGLNVQADQVLKIISKIGNKSDCHTKELTSEKMVINLKNHGTVFNLSDDSSADDFLNADVGGLEVSEKDLGSDLQDFEDERE